MNKAKAARIIASVAQLVPNEAFAISLQDLNDALDPFEHNGATFTPADRVLENVMGSSYGWSYKIDSMSGTVTFSRQSMVGLNEFDRTYISPDKRAGFRQEADGIWRWADPTK